MRLGACVVAVLGLLGAGVVSSQSPKQGTTSVAMVSSLPIVFEKASSSGPHGALLSGRVGRSSVLFQAGGFSLFRRDTAQEPLEIRFAGGRAVEPAGFDERGSYTNYLIGEDPRNWRTHVANYGRVRYSQIYPGVDAVFYGNGGSLEHDFIVAPGANASVIHLKFSPQSQLRTGSDGALEVIRGKEITRFERPTVYQHSGQVLQPRRGRYKLLGNGEVGFDVGIYDHNRALVIDPVLTFSTYTATIEGNAQSVATDAAGNTYTAGDAALTYSATPGAFSSCSGCGSSGPLVVVSKLSADGSKLIFSSVFGGDAYSQATGLAADGSGNVIVSGFTSAGNFPTKNGQNISSPGNSQKGFVLSLTPDGSALNYSTYLGSTPSSGYSSNAAARAVTVDSAGNAYVTGITGAGFPVSSGAVNNQDPSASSRENVFLTKLSPLGVPLYSAILGVADPTAGVGGGGMTGPAAVQVDAAGEAFVGGRAGALWTTTNGAYSRAIAGTSPFAAPFVDKISADGSSLMYATFLDTAYSVAGIALASDGSIFLAGSVPDPTFKTTAGAYAANTGANGGFVARLNATGSGISAATVLGDKTVNIGGIAVGPDGGVWLTGSSRDSSFPLASPVQGTFPTYAPAATATILSEFDSNLSTLQFSTYLGGNSSGFGNAVAVDAKGLVHVAGATTYGAYMTPGAMIGQVPMPAAGYSGLTFPYVAELDPSMANAALCISPNAFLAFSDVAVKGAGERTVTLTSCGTQALSVGSVSTTGGVFSVPATENTCPVSLPAGQACKLKVRYAPTAIQQDTGSLSVATNAVEATQAIQLTGDGQNGSVLQASVNSLNFGAQAVGTTSTAQMVTITNQGSGPAQQLQVSLDGDSNGSFKQTGNCGSTLAVGASCTVTVTYAPTAVSTADAFLDLYSLDASTLSQVGVELLGSSPMNNFSLAASQGNTAMATVVAGQTASYGLAVAGVNGYKGTVTLTCANLPVNASCSINPSSVAINGAGSQLVTVSVATQLAQNSATGINLNRSSVILAALVMPFCFRRRKNVVGICLLLIGMCGFVGCSGSSSGSGTITPPAAAKVAPGTYNVQLTASDGTAKQMQTLQLVVQ